MLHLFDLKQLGKVSSGLCVSLFSAHMAFAAELNTSQPTPPPIDFNAAQHPVSAQNGMVVAQDALAAQVGRDILRRGGNAVDAAVATGFALAVTHPQAGNIGGGGFMLIALDGRADVIALDFREVAPSAATRDMFLGADGEVDLNKAFFSHDSSGVPGTVMGLLDALETYGTMTRRQVMGPAIRLASRGFEVSPSLHTSLIDHKDHLGRDASSENYFYGAKGQAPQIGSVLKQADLARTLRDIVEKGQDGFYKGRVADLLIAEIKAGGGTMTHEDLAQYSVKTRMAVTGSYKGYEISAMPPPSSGGIHLIQMLNMLSGYDLSAFGHNSANYMHTLIETMRRAYADRSKYLGDPDFVEVPVKALMSPEYARMLREQIDPDQATSSDTVRPGLETFAESPQTTHYSVIDKAGNAVSVTYTLNFSYGSGHSVDGAGFLLNNEMDDFSAKPGSPNAFGLIGGTANQIAPGKRPLSSMTPAIARKDGDVVLVTGSIGGSRIITAVLQVILNVIEFDMNIQEAVTAPRFHHQWQPDVVTVEPGISRDTLDILSRRGHNFDRQGANGYVRESFGRANSIAIKNGYVFGAADGRDPKSGASGY